ncbi:MAG: hypothetical protein M2R45_05348 [Verrucomicrobia subdivision 3 bacterium]|nr:hypothetical protein [Limisphaerales bacterium]
MEKAGTLKVRGKRHPRLQLLSVPDILAGRRFKLPEAPAARGSKQTQLMLSEGKGLHDQNLSLRKSKARNPNHP